MNAPYWKRVLIAAQEAGKTCADVARDEEVHRATVHQWADRLGIRLTPGRQGRLRTPLEERARVAALDWEAIFAEAIANGRTRNEVAKMQRCHPSTVGRRARGHGVTLPDERSMAPKSQRPQRTGNKSLDFQLERMARAQEKWGIAS